jgi:hypothetical protein
MKKEVEKRRDKIEKKEKDRKRNR